MLPGGFVPGSGVVSWEKVFFRVQRSSRERGYRCIILLNLLIIILIIIQ